MPDFDVEWLPRLLPRVPIHESDQGAGDTGMVAVCRSWLMKAPPQSTQADCSVLYDEPPHTPRLPGLRTPLRARSKPIRNENPLGTDHLRADMCASIDQNTCITAKMYAALTPNSSIPSTASRAPISRQCRCSVSPDAPRVLIESTEKSKASIGESRAPSHKYAAAQIPHSIPCRMANSSPITTIKKIRIAISFHKIRARASSRARILTITKAIITTAVAWIATVNAMSDRPQCQLGWSNVSIECAPQNIL